MKLSDAANRRIRRIFGLVLSLMLVTVAVLFITSAVTVNSSGDSPYTYASIGAAFRRISVPVLVTLALAVLGGIWFGYIAVPEEGRVKPPRDLPSQLRRAARYADLSAASPERRALIRRERNIRLALRVANAIYFFVGMAIAFLCAVNPENYAEGISSPELTASVLGVVLAAVIYVTPSLIMALLLIPINALSCEYELKLIRELPKRRAEPAPREDTAARRTSLALNCTRITLILVAVVLIVMGINNGGMEDVVQKAVKICTECIGLG